MGGPSYTRIPGSERLKTGKRGCGVAAVVEGADRASLARASIEIDEPTGARRLTLGRVLLRGPSIPLLNDVVDRLLPLLQPEEAVVYLHLYRLAVDVDKNVCRVSRAELTRRTRLADRRLGRAIAGLVDKRAVVLVDRSRDGTLYRVLFPDEILDVDPVAPRPTPRVVPSSPSSPALIRATPPAVVVAAGGPSPLVAAPTPLAAIVDAAPAPFAPRSVGDVCSWFSLRFGGGPGRTGTDVASCVLELLEEGHTFRQIPALLEAFMAKAPKTTPLRDLLRVLG